MPSNTSVLSSSQSIIWMKVIIFLSCVLLVELSSIALAADISGIISLPSGLTAPAGGILVTLEATDSNTEEIGGADSRIIPEGSTFVNYTLIVPDDEVASWRVSYSYPGKDYLSIGYYSIGKTVYDLHIGKLLPGGQNYTDIDMTLLVVRTIAGIISLPLGEKAPLGGIRVGISSKSAYFFGGYFSSSVIIPENSTSVEYVLKVPEDRSAAWRVGYFDPTADYLSYGYYATAGTTRSFQAATLLPGSKDYTGIDMILLTGNTIRGTISLPEGLVAPTGGILIDISMYDKNLGGYVSRSFSIPANSTSLDYSLAVPDDLARSWSVKYSYLGQDYLLYGFYSARGTTWDRRAITRLSGGQDHVGIDMTLFTGKIISGIITRPLGQMANADSARITIHADSENNAYRASCQLSIPKGSASMDYTLKVPGDVAGSWRVHYSYLGSDYAPVAYFTSAGTTWDSSAATLLPGGHNYTDIDMTLLGLKTITGTLFLPFKRIAPAGGVRIYISSNGGRGINVTIPAGSTFADYTLRVPDDSRASWWVRYSYLGSDFASVGYYATTGTLPDSSAATLLPGGKDYTDIDITLLKTNFPWIFFLPTIIDRAMMQ